MAGGNPPLSGQSAAVSDIGYAEGKGHLEYRGHRNCRNSKAVPLSENV